MITDMSDYTRIYLKPVCHAGEDTVRLWCQDDEPQPCLDGERWTPYILASEYDRLQAECDALVDSLEALLSIVPESYGVSGYHLNGEVAEWDEFEEVGIATEVLATYRKQGGES